MTPHELATKIAEDVFRTIEREKGIVKAEIADAVEKVLAQNVQLPDWAAVPMILFGEPPIYKALSDAGAQANSGGFVGRGQYADPTLQQSLSVKPGEWKVVSSKSSKAIVAAGPLPSASVVSTKYVGSDYLDEDAQVKAFEQYTQYVGPPMGYYINHDGARYRYQPFGWQSDNPAKIVARVEALAAQIAASGAHTIIWRCKPEFERMSDGKWAFYCRFHVLPYVRLPGGQPECELPPEA